MELANGEENSSTAAPGHARTQLKNWFEVPTYGLELGCRYASGYQRSLQGGAMTTEGPNPTTI